MRNSTQKRTCAWIYKVKFNETGRHTKHFKTKTNVLVINNIQRNRHIYIASFTSVKAFTF